MEMGFSPSVRVRPLSLSTLLSRPPPTNSHRSFYPIPFAAIPSTKFPATLEYFPSKLKSSPLSNLVAFFIPYITLLSFNLRDFALKSVMSSLVSFRPILSEEPDTPPRPSSPYAWRRRPDWQVDSG